MYRCTCCTNIVDVLGSQCDDCYHNRTDWRAGRLKSDEDEQCPNSEGKYGDTIRPSHIVTSIRSDV